MVKLYWISLKQLLWIINATIRLRNVAELNSASTQNCITSFIILSILAQNESDINRAVLNLQRKNLICNRCLLIFANKIDKIPWDILSAMKGVDKARDVVL